MRVDIIEGIRRLGELRANWDAVYDADPESQFFLSSIWMFKWLGAIRKPWFVLAVRPDDASPYVAFFPLWLQTQERKDSGFFYNELHMGGHHSADYTGFLCRPEFEEQAIPALAASVHQLNWTYLRLDALRMSDERLSLFLRAFSSDAFHVCPIDRFNEDGIDNSICPLAPLPGDWDAYLDGLSANMRQKIRRLLRQMEKSDEIRITHATKETVGRDIDMLLRFWSDRWGARKGAMLKGIVGNYRLMLRHAFEAGALFMPVLWQGDRQIGSLAILIDSRKKVFHFYIAGRDQAFDGPPPGTILHAHSIRHAIRQGIVAYDFLRGNEPYKYSFGVEERRIGFSMLATKDRVNLGGRLDKRSMPLALQRAEEHFAAGRQAEAERGFRQVLDIEPRDPQALYGLARIMAGRAEHAVAVDLLQALVALKPDIARAWFWLGRSLRARGALAAAAAAYCEGIERQPGPPIPGAYHELGQILLDLGCFDAAAATFDAVVDLQPDFPDGYASLLKALDPQDAAPAASASPQTALDADMKGRIARLPAVAALSRRNRPALDRISAAAGRSSGATPPPFLSRAMPLPVERLKGQGGG